MHPPDRTVLVEPSRTRSVVNTSAIGGTVGTGDHAEELTANGRSNARQTRYCHGSDITRGSVGQPLGPQPLDLELVLLAEPLEVPADDVLIGGNRRLVGLDLDDERGWRRRQRHVCRAISNVERP